MHFLLLLTLAELAEKGALIAIKRYQNITRPSPQ
jgi:hypothetical protein